MNIIQAVITGAVQGLSEFLPVSSSAHIVFSNAIYNLFFGIEEISQEEEIFFDITVHLATLFAVVIYFFNDLKNIFIDSFNALKNKDYQNSNLKLVSYIALTVIITGTIGLLIKEPVENLIKNPQTICFLLCITGIILLISEKFYSGKKEISLKSSILIAIAQGLAVFPGLSRSGLTIATGLFCGMERTKAARFSFLMSIPVIFLASLIYPLLNLDFSQILSFNWLAISIGALTAFIVGYLCIKYFMKLLGLLSLKIFGYYCLAVGFVMFFVFQAFYHLPR